MENQYKQLTQIERYQIEALCKLNQSAREISKELRRSNKTISSELGCCISYCAKEANEKAQSLRKNANNAVKYKGFIETLMIASSNMFSHFC